MRRLKTNFLVWRKIANSKSPMGTTQAARITRRLLPVYAPLTLPHTLPLTLTAQNAIKAFRFPYFDLLYAQTQPFVLGLPVDYYQFIQRNHFWLF